MNALLGVDVTNSQSSLLCLCTGTTLEQLVLSLITVLIVCSYLFVIHLPLQSGLGVPSCCLAFKQDRLPLKCQLVIPEDFHAALFCNHIKENVSYLCACVHAYTSV